MRTVAERYGVSDVWLAKTCRRLDVPVPRPRLLGEATGGQGARSGRRSRRSQTAQPDRIVGMRCEAPPQAEPLAGLDAAEPLELPTPVVVAESLERPHKLVAISARYLQKATPRGGVVSARAKHLPRHLGLAGLARPRPAHHGCAPQVPGDGRPSGRDRCHRRAASRGPPELRLRLTRRPRRADRGRRSASRACSATRSGSSSD